MCNLKWWHFPQNNSGGYYIENDVVGVDVFIQAKSSEEVADKAYALFEDYSEYCECCGERWSVWSNSSEASAKDNPSFFSRDLTKVAYNPITGSSRSYAVIHDYDGRITKLKCGELYKEVVQWFLTKTRLKVMVIKFEYQSYDNCYEPGSVHEIKGESIGDVYISYDGGRLHVSINNVEVLGTALAGNSFSINVEQKNAS